MQEPAPGVTGLVETLRPQPRYRAGWGGLAPNLSVLHMATPSTRCHLPSVRSSSLSGFRERLRTTWGLSSQSTRRGAKPEHAGGDPGPAASGDQSALSALMRMKSQETPPCKAWIQRFEPISSRCPRQEATAAVRLPSRDAWAAGETRWLVSRACVQGRGRMWMARAHSSQLGATLGIFATPSPPPATPREAENELAGEERVLSEDAGELGDTEARREEADAGKARALALLARPPRRGTGVPHPPTPKQSRACPRTQPARPPRMAELLCLNLNRDTEPEVACENGSDGGRD